MPDPRPVSAISPIATHETREIAARFSLSPPVSVSLPLASSRPPAHPPFVHSGPSPPAPLRSSMSRVSLLRAISTMYINTLKTPAGAMHDSGRVINQGSVSDASATFKLATSVIASYDTLVSGRGYFFKSPLPFRLHICISLRRRYECRRGIVLRFAVVRIRMDGRTPRIP